MFHAGDGNIHPILLFDERDPEQVRRVLRASHEILDECIACGGSVTGEHGIGVEKMSFMPKLFTPEDLAAMAAIRLVFNPQGRCSPDKMLPGGGGCLEKTSPGPQGVGLTEFGASRVPERPPFSRFRRLPGLFRTGEARPPEPHEEPQLLSLYLPGPDARSAEGLAMRDGGQTVQEYCEALLMRALDAEDARSRAEAVGVHHDLMEDVWKPRPRPRHRGRVEASSLSADRGSPATVAPGLMDGPRAAVFRPRRGRRRLVPGGLRRGEPVHETIAGDLLGAGPARRRE